jgi:uncharacterized membrane protein
MRIETSVEILRPPEAVWPVMVDVERWPEWTASVTKLERLDSDPFGLGSRVRIRQPKLKTMIWRVREFQEGRSFTWEARSPGVYVSGRHEIRPADRGSIATLTVIQSGWLASLLAPFFTALAERYVQIEAQGLKKRCEASYGL